MGSGYQDGRCNLSGLSFLIQHLCTPCFRLTASRMVAVCNERGVYGELQSSSEDDGLSVWLMEKGGPLPVAAGRPLELPRVAGGCFPPCVLPGAASAGSCPGVGDKNA